MKLQTIVSRRPTLPVTETAFDAQGVYVKPRTTLTLIEKLLLRSQGKAVPTVRRRGRGRPRMLARGKTAILAGGDVANVVDDSSYTDLAGSGLAFEDGKTSNAGGAE